MALETPTYGDTTPHEPTYIALPCCPRHLFPHGAMSPHYSVVVGSLSVSVSFSQSLGLGLDSMRGSKTTPTVAAAEIEPGTVRLPARPGLSCK